MTTDSKSELSDLSVSHSQSSSSSSGRLCLEYPGTKEESVSNDRCFQASSPPTSPHGSVAGSLESTPDKAKIVMMYKGKVHMILQKVQELDKAISESIMPYLKGIHVKMDVFAKTGDGLDEVKARLQALKTQQNNIKKHVQANNGALLKKGQNAAKQMDVTLLSNQLEKLGDKFESFKKVLSPGDVDALLNEREALRKEKNSEIKYLQDELARARGRNNSFGVFHLLLVLVVAVILANLSQLRFRKNTYGTL